MLLSNMGAQQVKEKFIPSKIDKAKRPKIPGQLTSSDDAINENGFWRVGSIRPSPNSGSSSNLFSDVVVALCDYDNPGGNGYHPFKMRKGDQLRLHGYTDDGEWADVESRAGDRSWVPTDNVTQVGNEIIVLDMFTWYHGAISRNHAEYVLNSGITGSFLVRESESNPGLYSISLRCESKLYHYRILQDSAGMYYVTESHRYKSIPKMIQFHGKEAESLACALLYPAPKRAHATLFGLGGDVWEIERSDITMNNKLGGGQYGIVYEAFYRKLNIVVAVKTLKEDIQVKVDEFLDEAQVMKSLKHQNLVQLIGVCTREPPYFIITEYMPNGNLLEYLRSHSKDELTPPVLLYMATQIACGMSYLEKQNFIHRDLAARNCLVGVDHIVKVADFGLARCMERDDTYTAHVGAKFPIKWTAPEGLAYNTFSTKSDVWAFGVLLWEIATYGIAPYPGVELQDVFGLLKRGVRMEQPEGCPDNVYKMMQRCWQWEPTERPTFGQIYDQLETMFCSIDEQVALQLAREEDEENAPQSRGPIGGPLQSLQIVTNNNTPPKTRGPPPPPPKRSASAEQLIDNAESNSSSSSNSQVPRTKMQTTQPEIPRPPTTPSTDFSSLGRKKAPEPPRRLTPVRPLDSPPGSDNIMTTSADFSSPASMSDVPQPPHPPPRAIPPPLPSQPPCLQTPSSHATSTTPTNSAGQPPPKRITAPKPVLTSLAPASASPDTSTPSTTRTQRLSQQDIISRFPPRPLEPPNITKLSTPSTPTTNRPARPPPPNIPPSPGITRSPSKLSTHNDTDSRQGNGFIRPSDLPRGTTSEVKGHNKPTKNAPLSMQAELKSKLEKKQTRLQESGDIVLAPSLFSHESGHQKSEEDLVTSSKTPEDPCPPPPPVRLNGPPPPLPNKRLSWTGPNTSTELLRPLKKVGGHSRLSPHPEMTSSMTLSSAGDNSTLVSSDDLDTVEPEGPSKADVQTSLVHVLSTLDGLLASGAVVSSDSMMLGDNVKLFCNLCQSYATSGIRSAHTKFRCLDLCDLLATLSRKLGGPDSITILDQVRQSLVDIQALIQKH